MFQAMKLKSFKLLSWLTVALIVSSCASLLPSRPQTQAIVAPPPNVKTVPTPSTKVSKVTEPIPLTDAEHVEQIEALTIDDVVQQAEPSAHNLYDNSRYDFPITLNAKVEQYMDYFTGRGRPHFERYLARSSRYIPLMRQILKNEGLPEDLVYLAMIESGFNLTAFSRAKAVGPWQFMSGTGKRYGLKIDSYVDERQDPIRATVAAARYLKDLYLMFESWYLAAAAYNAGEYRILRATKALNTNNYWAIAQSNHIRRETKDYVPKLIAAAILAKNAEKYNFTRIDYQEPFDFETVTLSYPLRLNDLARYIDISPGEVTGLNPELKRGMVPPYARDYALRVPVGTSVLVERALATHKDTLSRPARPREYVIKKGDHLHAVAKKMGVSLQELVSLNNLNRRNKVYPGQRLRLPPDAYTLVSGQPERTIAKTRARKPTPKAVPKVKVVVHTVKQGESLWSIAEKYEVTVDHIYRKNQLRNSKIIPGRRLTIQPNA